MKIHEDYRALHLQIVQPLDESEEESEKVGLKLNRKLKSWHPVPSWQTDRETVATVTDCFLGGRGAAGLQNHCRW